MTQSRWGRRHFLRKLGLGAAALPFVPILDAHAASSAPPRRIVFFFSGNGTIRESWVPSMSAGQLTLSPILSPLERHKSKLLVVDGLCHKVIMEKGERSGHSAGINTVLTGKKAKQIDPQYPLRSLATGISLDQYLASRIGTETKLRSVECGIQVLPFSTDNAAISYSGPLEPMLAENSPYRVFDRLFRGFSEPSAAESADAAEALADRKRVLSSVSKQLEVVKSELPQSDRIKMEAHLDAVRAIEHSLTTGVGAAVAPSCTKPDLGAPIDVWKNDDIPAVGKLQMDLLVMALACDLTRIGTIQFGRAGAGHRFNWLGPEFASDPALAVTDQAKGFHALAHKESDPVSRAKLVKIHAWYASQLAYFLDKLSSIHEGGGTMLDNTLVVWINELGSGGNHTHDNTPWVLAGNVGKTFKTGRLVSFPGEPHNRMLLTLLHAMGVADTSFGDPDYCGAGPLTGMTT